MIPSTKALQTASVALGAAAVHHSIHANPSPDTLREWAVAVQTLAPWIHPAEAADAVAHHFATTTEPMTTRRLLSLVRQQRLAATQLQTHTQNGFREIETDYQRRQAAQTTDNHRSRPCPKCGAAAGELCINETTGRTYDPRVPGHPQRAGTHIKHPRRNP